MKRALLFFALCVNSLFAAPAGDPFNPAIIKEGFFISPGSWINVRAGYEGNFVYNAKMEKDDGADGIIDNFKQDVQSGTLTINIHDRFDLYGVVGESRIRSDWRFKQAPDNLRIELESHYKFCYGVGAKAIFFEWGNFVLSGGGRYFTTSPDLLWLVKNGVEQAFDNSKIDYKEWQGDLGMAYKIDFFIPYIGAKYSSSTAKIHTGNVNINTDSNSISMENRENFGLYLGCSISNSKYFMLGLEVRLIDEEAFTISGDIRF
ncbi:MAG: hypothetical protein HZB76_02380 [Chlamydiae bacterium]|nr:hypothetical protein [Chlamydiota bacterium]